MEKKISRIDVDILEMIRKEVAKFLTEMALHYDKKGMDLLDIAPEVHEGAKAYFLESNIKTLDIDPQYHTDYVLDLCNINDNVIPDESFDVVVCTEVLEHVSNPFAAVREIHRMLKYGYSSNLRGGVVCVSVPFNFRIHGPLPDCWRFTVHGLKELFKDFEIIDIKELKAENRFLMPYHYTLVACKK